MNDSYTLGNEEIQDWFRYINSELDLDRNTVPNGDIYNPASPFSRALVHIHESANISGTVLVDAAEEYLSLMQKYKTRYEEQNKEYQEYLRLKSKFE